MTELHLQSLKGWRAEVGMLAPLRGMYREWEAVAPEGVRFSKALLGLEEATPESMRKIAETIEVEAKKLNVPQKQDLICFGCTWGSFIEGPGFDQMLIERIEKATGVPATTTITCVTELFKDMGIKKIALVGPYVDSVFDVEVKFLKAYGIETLTVKGLGISELTKEWDYYMDPYGCYEIIKEGAEAAPEADCVFVTCMMSSIVAIVDTLEEQISKPIISSPSATLYGILKKLGIQDPVPHYGQALVRPRR